MLVMLEVLLGGRLLVAKLPSVAIFQPWTSKLAAGSGKDSWQEESGTAAGSDPFGQQAPTTPVLKQQDEGWALPLSQLCSLPLLAAGIAWLCSLLRGGSAQCCPVPALLHWLQCHSKWQNAAAPSAQPGVGKEACLGGAGTKISSFITTSNKASRCLGRDGAWRSGMCLNIMFMFGQWYWLLCE